MQMGAQKIRVGSPLVGRKRFNGDNSCDISRTEERTGLNAANASKDYAAQLQ